MTPITTLLQTTLTLTLTGTYEEARPDEPAIIDDIWIDDLFLNGHSLLENVDTSNPSVIQLLTNLISACEEEAADALGEAVE